MPLANYADLGAVLLLFAGSYCAFVMVRILLDHRDYRRSRKAFLEQQRLLKSLYHIDRDEPPPPMKVTRKDNVVRIKDEIANREKS